MFCLRTCYCFKNTCASVRPIKAVSILLHTPQPDLDLQTSSVPSVAGGGEGKQYGAKGWICIFLLFFLKYFNSSLTLLGYIIAALVFIIIVWFVSISNYRLSYISIQSCKHCVKVLVWYFLPPTHLLTTVNFLPIIQYSKMYEMVGS